MSFVFGLLVVESWGALVVLIRDESSGIPEASSPSLGVWRSA